MQRVRVGEIEMERFEAQILDLLEAPLRLRTGPEKKRISDDLLAHMLRFSEMQTSQKREKSRREKLEAEVAVISRALEQAHADVSALTAGAQHAQFLARHDPLTELPNGAHFRECLNANVTIAHEQHQSIGVLYVDVDNFKSINDTHGHAIGDAVLRIVGARLTGTLRAEDMVSRLGGDEFACFVSGCQSREQVEHLAKKLIDSVATTTRVYSLALAVQISVGIALYPQDGSDAESLLRDADAAMYRAKRERRGLAFFDATIDSRWSS